MLIDMQGYLGTQMDLVGVMQTVAKVSDHLTVGQSDRIMVYLAPNPETQIVANFAAKSIAAIAGILVRVTDNRLHALDILEISIQG